MGKLAFCRVGNDLILMGETLMMRWSIVTILSMASVCCLAASMADDKEKTVESAKKVEKAESTKSKAAADKKEAKGTDGAKKFTAKCPVSGADAKEEQFTAYKEKNVYFCCEKCKAAFEAEPTKFEVKANHQLVQTKQFAQKKCPLSGGPINKEESARVSSVNVKFCCGDCKAKVQSAEAAEKLEMIFAEKAFKKAFVAAKVKTDDETSSDKPKTEKKPAKAKEEKT